MPKPNPKTTLLSRTDFRNGTFARDNFRCVICGLPAVDAHHIIERRLFKAAHEQGGYFLDNGASLCVTHHREAEYTNLSCQTIRQLCGIITVKLPEHFWPELEYDKWGNIITQEGRLKGELYYEMSVKTILQGFNFLRHIIFPKTCHLPWSRALSTDIVLENDDCFAQEEVVLFQMDGLPFTSDNNSAYGEKMDDSLPKELQKHLLHQLAVLDDNMIVGGHYSVHQPYLSSIWIENECLDWANTQELAIFLNIPLPPILFEGIYNKNAVISALESHPDPRETRYKLRLKKGFKVFDLNKSVAEYVAGN